MKAISIIMLALAISTCAGGPDERDTFDDIDDLITAAAWEVVDILAEHEGRTLVVSYFTEEGEESYYSDFLVSGLTAEIANAANEEEIELTVVSRESLDGILDELSFQMSDLAAKDSQLTIGQQIGADVILTGTITEFEDAYKVHGQLVEVESGTVLCGFAFSLED